MADGDQTRAYKNGFREGAKAAAGIARRLANEIKADLKKAPRGFRSSARMRAMAEMFEGVAELIESEDPNAVETALADLRKGFGYVARKEHDYNWTMFKAPEPDTLPKPSNVRALKPRRK